jgi:hypothetical protein
MAWTSALVDVSLAAIAFMGLSRLAIGFPLQALER